LSPHSTRRPDPDPPCPAGRSAPRRASESPPAWAGPSLPCYGSPWPSNTGLPCLPPPLRLMGRERQALAGASLRLGARGARIAAGPCSPAPGPTGRCLLAPIRRLGQAGSVLVAPGERVLPPTLRAGRPPSKGHVSPKFSTRSGHYPPTVPVY
jgi:hypothetical protein